MRVREEIKDVNRITVSEFSKFFESLALNTLPLFLRWIAAVAGQKTKPIRSLAGGSTIFAGSYRRRIKKKKEKKPFLHSFAARRFIFTHFSESSRIVEIAASAFTSLVNFISCFVKIFSKFQLWLSIQFSIFHFWFLC